MTRSATDTETTESEMEQTSSSTCIMGVYEFFSKNNGLKLRIIERIIRDFGGNSKNRIMGVGKGIMC